MARVGYQGKTWIGRRGKGIEACRGLEREGRSGEARSGKGCRGKEWQERIGMARRGAERLGSGMIGRHSAQVARERQTRGRDPWIF